MKTLCGLKLKIGLKPDGKADHPNFNLLQVVADSGAGDWAYYLDSFGGGMHYDSLAGHKEDIADSPVGMQWGLMLVPEEFAAQAIAKFPTVCERLSPTDCAAFYDDRVAINQEEYVLDVETLAGIEVADRLTPAITDERLVTSLAARKKAALDPDNKAAGIRRNEHKTWAQTAAQRGFDLV